MYLISEVCRLNGKLYIIPTPIGNLKDISFRIIEILNDVDAIAAEDTRHSLRLLNHYEIKKPLISYHEHNKAKAGEKLIGELLSGKNIALVSDAGMPGISDPGADIVKLAIDNNIDIEVLPGPTAFVNALVLSGLDTREFHFVGFLDRNKNKRKEKLIQLKEMTSTLIFYESPHRIKAMLKDMEAVLGNRKIAVAREITKKFEEVLRGEISLIHSILSDREIKGEFVVVVSGNNDEADEPSSVEDLPIEEMIRNKMMEGMSKKEAIKDVSRENNLPKREVYKIAMDIEVNE